MSKCRLQDGSDVHMTLGVCYHAAKSMLNELEMTEFSLGQTKIKSVAIFQFRMHKCCGYCGCGFQIKIRSYATEITKVIEAGFTGSRNMIVIDKLEATMKPIFLAK